MAEAAARDEREVDRTPAACRVEGFDAAAQPLVLDLLNISPHGLMAANPGMAVGDRIRLRLPVAGVVAAEVRWTRDDRFGCRFDRPIDPVWWFELLTEVMRRE